MRSDDSGNRRHRAGSRTATVDKAPVRRKPRPRVLAPATNKASPAVIELKRLVERFRYPQAPQPWPLTNLTIFAGAGFSKSWDTNAPVGTALFTLDWKHVAEVLDPEVLARQFGTDRGELGLEDIRQINYQIDMYERYPDIRSRYLDGQNLPMIRAALRAAVVARYAELTDLNFFDANMAKFPLPAPTPERAAIMGFFRHLHGCVDGSQFFAEGLRTNIVTTNYDFVPETILDNLVGPDDSFTLYNYRGFTPAKVAGHDNPKPTHGHWFVSQLIKLNGGFEILPTVGGYMLDYSPRSRSQVVQHPPIIMLPSREQDYGDPYFSAIFPKAVRLMRETRILLIVGYSMPPDDALMRFIIRQFSEEPEDGREKVVFYVDPGMTETEMRAKVAEVFPTMRSYAVPAVLPFRGTFADFAAQYVSLIEPGDRPI